ncbi:MAG: YncE family protein [Solirubrobacteraceae bacterium]
MRWVLRFRPSGRLLPISAALACATAVLCLLAAALPEAGVTKIRSRSSGSGAHLVLAVANSYDGTVDLIEGRSFRRLGRPLNVIPDGATPRDPQQAAAYPLILARQGEVNYAQEVAFSPDGKTLYVSRGYLGDVAAFSVATHRLLWRLQVPGLRADHLALSGDGRRLFVSALPGTKVYAINVHAHRYIGSYEAGTFPHVLELSPDGHFIYSGSLGDQLASYGQDHGSHQITVANARTLKVVRTYRFAAGVRPFAFASANRLVVQLSYVSGFEVLNLATGRTRTIKLPLLGPGKTLAPRNYPNAAADHGIAVSGNTVCAAGTISNYVATVSLRGRIKRIVTVGQAPAEALTSSDREFCLVTSRGPTGMHVPHVTNGDEVSVISYGTGKLVRRIAVGRHPQAETLASIPDATLRAGGFLK